MLGAFLIDAERAVYHQPDDRPGTLRADTCFFKIIYNCEHVARKYFLNNCNLLLIMIYNGTINTD